jgi:hypothetical protein
MIDTRESSARPTPAGNLAVCPAEPGPDQAAWRARKSLSRDRDAPKICRCTLDMVDEATAPTWGGRTGALGYTIDRTEPAKGIPMNALRLFLAVIFLAVAMYTAIVIANHGWNLLPVFFGDMAAMTWPGQFNFDFMGFLLLSGLWVSWRHRFSPGGLILGLLAVFGGVLFLSLYLLIASYHGGDSAERLLLGKSRTRR